MADYVQANLGVEQLARPLMVPATECFLCCSGLIGTTHYALRIVENGRSGTRQTRETFLFFPSPPDPRITMKKHELR
jgi:hypothetical protein